MPELLLDREPRQCTATHGQEFRYLDVGTGSMPIVLLHGLFGSPANWQPIMDRLAEHYRFFALQLPIDLEHCRRRVPFHSLEQLTDYVGSFFDRMELDRAVLCGNSLGGQVALDFQMRYTERVDKLVLCGSAGLYERNLSGGGRPRVCRHFIRQQAGQIFYDPAHVTEELVEDIYALLSDRRYRRLMLKVAMASRDRCMLDDLHRVDIPTMIIWGRNDSITPPSVAEEFASNISQAELVFLDRCGHSPPIEQPAAFSALLHSFLCESSSECYCPPRKPR